MTLIRAAACDVRRGVDQPEDSLMRYFLTLSTLILLWLSVLAPAAAAQQSVEITPQIGYRFGELEASSGIVCIDAPCPSFLASDDDIAYGVTVDFPLNENWQFELIGSRFETDLAFTTERGVADEPIGLLPSDLEINTFQAGFRHLWRLEGFSPYVAFGAGLSELSSSKNVFGPLIDEERLSASLAGGAQIPLNERFGVRLEARGYWIDLPSQLDTGGEFLDSELLQMETSAGLTILF